MVPLFAVQYLWLSWDQKPLRFLMNYVLSSLYSLMFIDAFVFFFLFIGFHWLLLNLRLYGNCLLCKFSTYNFLGLCFFLLPFKYLFHILQILHLVNLSLLSTKING